MSENPLALIVPAAGIGSRLGKDVPKPFIKINGNTILRHTLEKFVELDPLVQVIIPVSEKYKSIAEKILSDLFPHLNTKTVKGGKERQDSIRNAINALQGDVKYVAVHDAVRPFIKADIVLNCYHQACKSGGAITAIRAKDTIKQSNSRGLVENTPDRSRLWHAQTPQIFEAGLFQRAYRTAKDQNYSGTDDSSLIENIGGDVVLVEGSYKNFKITYPSDLEFATLLIEKQL